MTQTMLASRFDWAELLPPGSDWTGQKTQATSIIFSGLAPGTDHQFLIDAFACTATEAAGYVADATSPSCVIYAQIDSGSITSTGSNTATPDPVFSGSISVSWTPVVDAEGGAVWYAVITSDGAEVTTVETSATITDLAIGKEYNLACGRPFLPGRGKDAGLPADSGRTRFWHSYCHRQPAGLGQ